MRNENLQDLNDMFTLAVKNPQFSSSDKVIGEYAEYMFAEHIGGVVKPKNYPGVDVVLEKRGKQVNYQVKYRACDTGVEISSKTIDNADYLVVYLLEGDKLSIDSITAVEEIRHLPRKENGKMWIAKKFLNKV
jgi:hypothetical protein